jgi:hypothetical protein
MLDRIEMMRSHGKRSSASGRRHGVGNQAAQEERAAAILATPAVSRWFAAIADALGRNHLWKFRQPARQLPQCCKPKVNLEK